MGRLFLACFGLRGGTGGPKKKPHFVDPSYHTFRPKRFKKPQPCDVCRQPINNRGGCCRVCKFVCHETCEPKVISTCESPHFPQRNNDGLGIRRSPNELKKSLSYPVSHSTLNDTRPSDVRDRSRSRVESIEMDMTYITERMIAMISPEGSDEDSYGTALREVSKMLDTKHAENYLVINLSERRTDVTKLNRRVMDFGWPPRVTPHLERLCSICKAVDSWLTSDPGHVVVLHSRGGEERARVVVAAYMHYSNICASADQALDRFAMRRFYSEKLHGLLQPSQRRYIDYFSGLLSGSIKINSSPLYLRQILIQGTPGFDFRGGCRLFVKVYQGMRQIFTSGVYSVSNTTQRIPITLDSPLQLRGDILVKAYHRRTKPEGRVALFRCQFHTCAISAYGLTFDKIELDDAFRDESYPASGRVELRFSSYPENSYGTLREFSPPVDYSADDIVRADSYENLDAFFEESFIDTNEEDRDLNHTSGPVDGSLYATVTKRPEVGQYSHANDVTPDDRIIPNGPHTISMDSGISSTGPLGLTSSSCTPPHSHGTVGSGATTRTQDTAPLTPTSFDARRRPTGPDLLPDSEERRKLDELLSGMLADVESIPDVKSPSNNNKYTPPNTYPRSGGAPNSSTTTFHSGSTRLDAYTLPNGTADAWDGEEEDVPYHARKDSRPFTYGAPPTGPSPFEDYANSDIMNQNYSQSPYSYDTRNPEESSPLNPMDLSRIEFIDECEDEEPEPEPVGWLEIQQQKLRQRNEARVRGERQPKEQRLIDELKKAQNHRVQNEPHAGYATPLHVNTANGHWPIGGPTGQKGPADLAGKGISAPASPAVPPDRSSSFDAAARGRYGTWNTRGKSLPRQRSDATHDRERSFVAVKRAHERARRQAELQGVHPLLLSPHPLYNMTYVYSPIYQNQPQPNQPTLPFASSTPVSAGATVPGLLTTVGGRRDSISPESSLPRMSPAVSATSDRIVRTNQDTPMFNWAANCDGSTSPQSTSPSLFGFGDRPVTPAFPVHPRTPYLNEETTRSIVSGLPPKSPTSSRQDPVFVRILPSSQSVDSAILSRTLNGQSSPTLYFGQSGRSSMISLSDPLQVIHHHPVFVKDLSKFWYKPSISREDAIGMLRDKTPGTFIVRDSNSFPGAYGMALKVAMPPPNTLNKTGDISNELVRHFLIEPTSKGVKLMGCSNEPVFGSLSALVYQHSITPLALPLKLLLPEADPLFEGDSGDSRDAAAQLLAQGAACNVLYLFSMDMESLTGFQAVRKATTHLFLSRPLPLAIVVHFKVSSQGITLTDNNRKLFFRRHYPVNCISYCGTDTEDRRWTQRSEEVVHNQIFGFVARKPASKMDNQCHLFAELEPEQPASAIVNFVTKVLIGTPSSKNSFI